MKGSLIKDKIYSLQDLAESLSEIKNELILISDDGKRGFRELIEQIIFLQTNEFEKKNNSKFFILGIIESLIKMWGYCDLTIKSKRYNHLYLFTIKNIQILVDEIKKGTNGRIIFK